MNESIYIFAKITPKPEFYQKAKEAIASIIPMTRAELGCLEFTLHQNNEGSLYLYEQWTSSDALEQHYEMDYTKSVFESYQAWLANEPEITKLNKLM